VLFPVRESSDTSARGPMQGAQASCNPEGTPLTDIFPSFTSLPRRPSLSLDLYERFSQNNAYIIPDPDTMDIDMIDAAAGVPLASSDISPTPSTPLSDNTETQFSVVKPKNRKSAGKRESSDNSSAPVKKSLSVSNTLGPAQPSVTESSTSPRSDPPVPSTSTAGMSVLVQNFKYSSKDPPPYIVQVQSLDESSPIHPLHISKTV